MIANRVALKRVKGDAPAVVAGSRVMTYRELDERAERLALALAARGIRRGDLVGLCAGRRVETLVGMLGIWRAGAAYTIVEPEEASNYSWGRLRSAGCKLALTNEGHVAGVQSRGIEVAAFDELIDAPESTTVQPAALPDVQADDVAYVLYTSGSTGTSKGVMVTHGNLRHYTESIASRLGIAAALRYAHVSTMAADLGNTCILLSLHTGGTLHLVDEETRRNPKSLWSYLCRERIDLLKITPSHFRAAFQLLGATRNRPSLQYLILGGEALAVPLARQILESELCRVLVNHYGPTETTVGVTLQTLQDLVELGDLATGRTTVPIGMPFGRTRLLVRTDSGTYAASEAEGELYVGGPSVSKGYLGDEVQTRQRFVTNVEGDARFYRTGDRVRIDSAGRVEFLGRMDRQVKIAGHRVELGHVESALLEIPSVTGASATVAQIGAEQRLLAAITQREPSLTSREIRETLSASQSHYLVPHVIVHLDEFPINSNGKVDSEALQRRLLSTFNGLDVGATEDPTATSVDPIMSDVLAVWQRHLSQRIRDLDSNFFDLGGDSLVAIHVISDLQRKGYAISAGTFQKGLTVRLTADAIRSAASRQPEVTGGVVRSDSFRLTPAQRRFFEVGRQEPDHWNQAILLEFPDRCERAAIKAALDWLVLRHPILQADFSDSAQSQRGSYRNDVLAFSASRHCAQSELEVATGIYAASEGVQSSIRIQGPVFVARLMEFEARPSQLLLVAHHLVVDAVSWRNILRDLLFAYEALARGLEPPKLHPSNERVDVWLEQLESQRMNLVDDLSHWNRMFETAPTQIVRDRNGRNCERHSRTLWFALSRASTEDLEQRYSRAHMNAVLLGAFCQALARQHGMNDIVIETESHGRVAIDEEIDVSEACGWFTSSFPVRLSLATDAPLEHWIEHAIETLRQVPNLGIAYEVLRNHPSSTAATRAMPRVCFNFLGRMDLPELPGIAVRPSRYRVAPARGGNNQREFDWKLTARILDGQLVVDLSFSVEQYSTARVETLIREVRAALVTGAKSTTDPGPIYGEDGSSTGLLAYCPRQIMLEEPRITAKHYDDVLLTGATGFLGVHLLKALLRSTKARIHCIVRSTPGETPWMRLCEQYDWTFGEELKDPEGRVTVLDGDLSKYHMGLSQRRFEELSKQVMAVYHLAADTRLFGNGAVVEERNLMALRQVIGLVSRGMTKDLHYLSTLAVAGTNQRSDAVPFSERNLSIGQEHLNAYEASKYKAELLLRDLTLSGVNVFIYRAGNVTGDSRTGRFQRNADASRIVQILRAVARVGFRPKNTIETIALTPVDEVVDAVVALSIFHPSGGCFHVDNGKAIALERVFERLKIMGVPLVDARESSVAAVLERYGDMDDEMVALGRFWATRRERNVIYEHTYTQRLLKKYGVEFTDLDEVWLDRFLSGLIERGVLGTQRERSTSTRVARGLGRVAHVRRTGGENETA